MKLGIGLLGTAALIIEGLYAGIQAPVPQAAAPNASPVGGTKVVEFDPGIRNSRGAPSGDSVRKHAYRQGR